GIFSALGLTASIAGKLAGSYTYQVRACNSSGCSAFTSGFLVSVVTPGTPGPITGPSNSTTGSYTLSWGAATGTVGYYELYEDGASLIPSTTALSATLTRPDGTHAYKVRACHPPPGCSAFTSPNFVVNVLRPPGAPGSISAPAETGPSYSVSWGAATGTIDHYDLGESFNGGAWSTTSVTTTSKAFTANPYRAAPA